MGGKRKEYDGDYSITEVGFVLFDPRLRKLKPIGRWMYWVLWNIAVKERREVLPEYFYPADLSHECGRNAACLSHLCSIDARVLHKHVADMLHVCLIEMTPEGRIRVCGVRDKHPNLKWKDDGINDVIPPYNRPQEEEEEEKEEEGEYVGGLKTVRIKKEYYNQLRSTYPHIKHMAELKKADTWVTGNPERMKKNWHRFINNWFNRAEEQAPKSNQPPIPHVDDL